MNISFNLKEQIIIGITVAVLVLVVFSVFVFKPQYNSFNDARSAQEKELVEQQSKEAELKNLEVAKESAALTEAKSLSLSKKMPEDADLPSVLVELDNLGDETNVKVLDITPSAVTPAAGYSTLPVELKIVGSYFNITDFLYKLVKLPREYTVDTVSLEIAEQGYPLLSANVKATTFIYTPNASAATSSSGQTSTGSSGSAGTATEAGNQ